MNNKEKKAHLVREVNSPKSRLLETLRQLEATPGSTVAARQLGNIIARLEEWQMRHKN